METNGFEGLTKANDQMKRSGNDSRPPVVAFGQSAFPDDTLAWIYKPSRSAMTSAGDRSQGWRLVVERRRPHFVEPLMGWTGDDDPVAQVHLTFPTKDAALLYARRQGLTYVVVDRPAKGAMGAQKLGRRSFSDATLRRLGLGTLEESYARAMLDAPGRDADSCATAMGIVTDPDLTLAAKRSHLMDWAWNEYLAGPATHEGTPTNGKASRLQEIELALVALEQAEAAENANCKRSDQAVA
jgi:hypothetical protein